MKQLYVINRDQWRDWLSENHAAEASIWLIFYKKETSRPTIAYEAAVEEALCFGWIDSIIKKIDAARYARKFTPRSVKSIWSQLNKKRAAVSIDSLWRRAKPRTSDRLVVTATFNFADCAITNSSSRSASAALS